MFQVTVLGSLTVKTYYFLSIAVTITTFSLYNENNIKVIHSSVL